MYMMKLPSIRGTTRLLLIPFIVASCASIKQGDPPEITPYIGMSERLLVEKGCFLSSFDSKRSIELLRVHESAYGTTKSYRCWLEPGYNPLRISVRNGVIDSISH